LRDSFGWLVAIAFVIVGFLNWRKNGYWVPRFVHVLAALALVLGILVALTLDPQMSPFKRWSIVPVMVLMVYWAFLVFGSGIGVRQLNKFWSMHASMDMKDVEFLLSSQFGPYRSKSSEELAELGEKFEPIKLDGRSGKHYEFKVLTNTFIDKTRGASVGVAGLLAEMHGKSGSPLACATFAKTMSGIVFDDALAAPLRRAFWH